MWIYWFRAYYATIWAKFCLMMCEVGSLWVLLNVSIEFFTRVLLRPLVLPGIYDVNRGSWKIWRLLSVDGASVAKQSWRYLEDSEGSPRHTISQVTNVTHKNSPKILGHFKRFIQLPPTIPQKHYNFHPILSAQ